MASAYVPDVVRKVDGISYLAPMPQKALFISLDGITDPLGQSQVLPYLVGLSAKGFAISIASCEKPVNYEKNRAVVEAICANAGINWQYCFYEQKIPLVSQRKNFTKLKNLAHSLVKNGNIPLVQCRSYLPALIGLHLNKKYNTRFIFDMRGFWADERIDGNIWKLSNPVHRFMYRYFKKQEKRLLSEADYVVTLTENAKTEIESWQLNRLPPMKVIPCCADVNHFTISTAAEKQAVRVNLQIDKDAFVLGYLGSVGTWYMTDEMLDFFVELKKIKPNALLFFVTADDKALIIQAAAQKGIAEKDILIKPAKRNEVPQFISVFNVGLFFIKPLFSKKGSSPTKLAEMLACGIPVISNRGIGDCDTIITQYNCGVVIDDFSPAAYKAAIQHIDAFIAMPPQHFRDVALNNFSLEKGVEAYETIYQSLLI